MSRSSDNPAAYWRSETERLRNAAKWLAAALAGVASLLIAGIPLTSLGQLSFADNKSRVVVAWIALVVALGCAASMIRWTVAIFITRWITLADIEQQEFLEQYVATVERSGRVQRAWRRIRHGSAPPPSHEAVMLLADLDANFETLVGQLASDRADLSTLRQSAEGDLAVAIRLKRKHDEELERLEIIRSAVDTCVGFVNYQYTRERFARLAHRLVVTGIAAAAAIAAFAYAASPPRPDPVERCSIQLHRAAGHTLTPDSTHSQGRISSGRRPRPVGRLPAGVTATCVTARS